MIHITAKIKDGKVVPYEDILYHNELKKLEGHDIEVHINSIRIRSNPQNSYYWGTLIYMITSELINAGYQSADFGGSKGPLTRETVHEALKTMFSRKDIYDPITQAVIGTTTKSTTEMSTKEFGIYVSYIQQWAAETLALEIPDPSNTYSL